MVSENRKQAGLLHKKNECREAEEKAYMLANPLAVPTQEQYEKTTTELQTEQEKKRAWIRKRNGKLYDYNVKQLIQTTNNGSEILKQELMLNYNEDINYKQKACCGRNYFFEFCLL